MTSGVGAFLTPGFRRIYKEDHYTLLHTKYESSGPCGFGEEDLFSFPMTPPRRDLYGPQRHGWQDLLRGPSYICLCFCHAVPEAEPVWTPGARLAGFIKRTFIHSYTQNRKALGHVVLKK